MAPTHDLLASVWHLGGWRRGGGGGRSGPRAEHQPGKPLRPGVWAAPPRGLQAARGCRGVRSALLFLRSCSPVQGSPPCQEHVRSSPSVGAGCDPAPRCSGIHRRTSGAARQGTAHALEGGAPLLRLPALAERCPGSGGRALLTNTLVFSTGDSHIPSPDTCALTLLPT